MRVMGIIEDLTMAMVPGHANHFLHLSEFIKLYFQLMQLITHNYGSIKVIIKL